MSAIPVPYTLGQTFQGHYNCAQKSGAAVSIAAAGVIASLRFTGTGYMTLMRVKIGYSVLTAVTASPQMDAKAFRVTGFTTDYDGTLGVPCKMRSIMGTSAAAPRICTTAAMGTGVVLADGLSPFAACILPTITATNSTGTAVLLGVGVGGPMATLYEWTGLGQHPPVCGTNEGIVIQLFTANSTTGTINYYIQWEWAEGPSF